MKFFTIAIVLFFILIAGINQCFAQQPGRPYFSAQVGAVKFKDMEVRPQGFLSFGAHVKDAGIGIGTGLMKFENDKTAYVPLFLEFSVMPRVRKISPYGNVRLGTSIYNNSITSVKTTGGYYGSINFGVGAPAGKTGRIIFGIGYERPSFHTEIRSGTRLISTSTSLDGFKLFFGFTV